MNNDVASLPMIVTASWYTILPADFVRVGISRGAPRGHPAGYRRYTPLCPGAWFNSVPDEEYVRRYDAEILARLDSSQVVRDLQRISAGAPIALLCFERPQTDDGWCHRSLVAKWIGSSLGRTVPERGYELMRQGEHPMLPPHLRKKHEPW